MLLCGSLGEWICWLCFNYVGVCSVARQTLRSPGPICRLFIAHDFLIHVEQEDAMFRIGCRLFWARCMLFQLHGLAVAGPDDLIR